MEKTKPRDLEGCWGGGIGVRTIFLIYDFDF